MSRSGKSKLDLDLGGETVLERSIRNLLDASVDRVRVVVPEGSKLAPRQRVAIVANPERDDGLASSLRVGLGDLPHTTRVVLVALADKPLVRGETIRKLIDSFEKGGKKLVYPVYRGEQGHPVLWDVSLVGELVDVEGDRGAKSVLESHRDDASAVDVDDGGVVFDIDTPEDYRRALELV